MPDVAHDDAIGAYKKVLKTKPDNPSGFYTNIGDAYFKKGDMKQATRWFERTLDDACLQIDTASGLAQAILEASGDRSLGLPERGPEAGLGAASDIGAGVETLHADVTYELLDDTRAIMEGQLAPEMNEEITGHVEVRRVFPSSKFGNIAGSYVLDGEITRDSLGCD